MSRGCTIHPDDQTPAKCESFAILVAAGLNPNALSTDQDKGKAHDGLLEGDEVLGTVGMKEVAPPTAGAHTGFGFFATSTDQTKYREPHTIIHDPAVHGGTSDIVEAILSRASLDAPKNLPTHVIVHAHRVAVRLLELGASPVEVDSAGHSAVICFFMTPKLFHTRPFWGLFETLLRARHATAIAAPGTKVIAMITFGHDGAAMHLFLPAYINPSFINRHDSWQEGLHLAEADSNPQTLYDNVFRELFDRENSDGNGNSLLTRNNNGESPLHIALRDNESLARGVLAKVVEYVGGPKDILSAEPT
ncbi:hypothetical protein BGX38DRAFT_1327175 [Terfezia claveryi]|nr:hypothetical protein BGX38DRAFT_1327175 [Terfezia claveryi]